MQASISGNACISSFPLAVNTFYFYLTTMKAHGPTSVLICLVIVLLQGAGCRKSVPEADNGYGLPNATQSGFGVFAFRMNGVNYAANNDLYNLGASVIKDTVAVRAFFDYGRFFGGFYLGTAANAKLNTVYDLADTIHTYCLFVTDSTCERTARTSSFKTKSGQIMLTKVDSMRKIISGIFTLQVRIPACDELIVTAGRFDCRYWK